MASCRDSFHFYFYFYPVTASDETLFSGTLLGAVRAAGSRTPETRRLSWRRVGEWRYGSTILDLCTAWRWVASLKLRPPYPLDRRLSGTQSRFPLNGEETIFLLIHRIEPRLLGRPINTLATSGYKSELYRLPKWSVLEVKWTASIWLNTCSC
jgi:hypothetical protein